MDLSKLSTEDLKALQSGDLSKVSTDGLKALQETPAAPSYLDKVKANITQTGRDAGNYGAGLVRGAGSIGATLLAPIDAGARALGIQNDYIGRTDRRDAMTGGLQELGADPNSPAFKAGKFSGEVAGTAGAGGLAGNLLARGAGAVGLASEAAPLVNAFATNGFRTGATLSPTANLAVRSAGGAVAGGAQVGLADPEHADVGALVGGAVPGAAKVAGVVANGAGQALRAGAENMMKRAIKPTADQVASGEAATAVRTMLDRGLNPSPGGMNKLEGMVSELNDRVKNIIANSKATIDPNKVVNALSSTEQRFANDVAPTANLRSIGDVRDDFLNTSGAGAMPIQVAQSVKQGTYRNLKGQYGELGSATVEAKKGLARGLKDEISAAEPAVAPLNDEESKLLTTLGVVGPAANRNSNKNLLGLASFAVTNPKEFAAFMVDRSSVAQALIARAMNGLGGGLPESMNALAGPAAYRAIPSTTRR